MGGLFSPLAECWGRSYLTKVPKFTDPKVPAKGVKPEGRIIDPELKRLRFLTYVNDKLRGLTREQIAEKWNVSKDTVERTLSWGKKAGIIADAEDKLLSEIFPLAEATIKAAVQTDIQAAMKIYTMVVKGRDAKSGDGARNVDEDELAKFMAERRRRQQLLEDTTDGEVIHSPGALPSAALALPAATGAESRRPELESEVAPTARESNSEAGTSDDRNASASATESGAGARSAAQGD